MLEWDQGRWEQDLHSHQGQQGCSEGGYAKFCADRVTATLSTGKPGVCRAQLLVVSMQGPHTDCGSEHGAGQETKLRLKGPLVHLDQCWSQVSGSR